jgi:nucleotide-binding universal stress UspA family protein
MSYRNIAVAVEESDDLQILNKAIDISMAFNSNLTIIHVNDDLYELYDSLLELQVDEVLKKIDENSESSIFNALKGAENITVKVLIKRGPVQEIISSLVKEHNIDLLVCGHHHSFLSRVMPTYTGVINKVHSDILIVPI